MIQASERSVRLVLAEAVTECAGRVGLDQYPPIAGPLLEHAEDRQPQAWIASRNMQGLGDRLPRGLFTDGLTSA